MLIEDKELRNIRKQFEAELKRITENIFQESFIWLPNGPNSPQQYWQYELSLWSDEDWYNIPSGIFTGGGRANNSDLGIQNFFRLNDHLFGIMENAVLTGAMDSIIPLLQKAAALMNEDGSAVINVYAYVFTEDEWLKNVCEEYLLILHLDERENKELYIGCQQNERYRIKVPGSGGPMFLDIPFDKVEFFDQYERVDGPHNQPYYEYQVALSFAGEDRSFVSRLANELRQKKIRVFYDEYEAASLWGKDLYTHLDEVYRKKARFCVLFLSEHYKNKLWTNHERESAQARAFQENKEYLLPIRMDNTEIPGIRPTLGYINKQDYTIGQLADLIQKKIYGF